VQKPPAARAMRMTDGVFTAVKMEFNAGMLWLIPVGLALWFMCWVLWNWWREEHR